VSSAPILTKVLLPPRPPDLLRRERLLDSLHRHIDRKLLFISAPAGYGKTSLLIDFAHETDLTACWYALDPTDRDPRVFLEHVLASLAQRIPGFGERTRAVMESGAPLTDGALQVVGALVNEMVSQIPEWFVLILDDFHALEEAPEVSRILTTLLTYQPEHFHLVIASRTVPGTLPFISLAARGDVAGLGMGDLRFTPEEVEAVLTRGRPEAVSRREAAELADEAEGWITGILLTQQPFWDGALDVWARARASGEPIYDYLVGEVLDRQPPEMRSFLLYSSTLEVMSPRLCREALGIEDAARKVQELEQQNLFAVRLEERGDRFRYHALFRNFLQSRLERRSKDTYSSLHRQAAAWFEAQGDLERAARHNLSAGAPGEAARAVDRAARDLLKAGHFETLVRWVEQLPAAEVRVRPRLALNVAEAAFRLGRATLSARWLAVAEARARVQDDDDLLARVLATQALSEHNQGRYEEGLRLAGKALALPISPDSSEVAIAAVEAQRIRGMCLMRLGRLDEAQRCLRDALASSHEVENDQWRVLVQEALVACLYRQGRMEDSVRIGRAVVKTCRRLENPGYLAEALNDLAYSLYLRGEYAEALQAVEEALETARGIGHRRVEAFARTSLGEMLRDMGDSPGAVKALEQGVELADDVGPAFLAAFGREALALAHLRQGDVEAARRWAEEAVELAEEGAGPARLGRYQVTLGLAQVEAGEVPAGMETLEQGCALLENTDQSPEIARARLFLAYAMYRTGEEERALERVSQALVPYLTTKSGHRLRIEGQIAAPLIERAVAEGLGGEPLAALQAEIVRFEETAQEIIQQREMEQEPAPPALRVYGFGTSRVERDGTRIADDAWPSATARYLLIYLLCYSPATRDQIGADLWPDLRPARLPGTFHTTKYRLQQTLGVNPVVYEGGMYDLRDDVEIWFDVTAFERLLDQARRSPPAQAARSLQQAIDLYAGDFMEAYYADWSVAIRERLQQRYLEAAAQLADWLIRQRRYDRALALLRRGLTVDNLREDFYRRLMRIHALTDRPAEAIAEYRRCVVILERELSVGPGAETEALFEAIRQGRFPPTE
jgi:ATP/maltotriose-dependent transcriptional regulator MalT/DNA-binding SARP family transcriptional activator